MTMRNMAKHTSFRSGIRPVDEDNNDATLARHIRDGELFIDNPAVARCR